MASKDVKSSLKSARKCIKNKDYKEAIKHCKAVLKVDKTNYNALVFFGKCASELGQPDQALMAYKKATGTDGSQLLAWQGLASLCEKEDNPELKAELPAIYTKLLQFFEGDKTKWKETAVKCAEVLETKNDTCMQAVKMWEDVAMVTEHSDELFRIWTRIIKILEKKQLEGPETLKLQEIYERVVRNAWSKECDEQLEVHFENHIRLLQKLKAGKGATDIEEKIHLQAKAMTKRFPNSNFALDLLAKISLDSVMATPSPEITDIFQRLCHMNPLSAVGRIGLGCILFHEKKFLIARDLLQKGLEAFPDCPVGWLLLCQSQINLHDYKGGEKSAKKGLSFENVASMTVDLKLRKTLSMSMAEALYKQGQATASEAVKIYEQLLNESESQEEIDVLTGLGNAFLVLGETSQATNVCKKALLIDKTSHSALALQGQISFQEGYLDDAELRFLEAIERQQECAFYHFLLGKLYWEMNGNLRADKKKCLTQFLMAAKLDPYYSPSFLYLGHYHLKVLKDTRKASRCYQKAFDLDPSCDEAGVALGDSLMELGDQMAALNLYKNITATSAPGKGKWAWLRLGLYHLKQNESTEAITCLQSALRADPKDRHCWECLGEAYMSRGSYMAAMKAFTKANQLCPSSLYCLYQLAAIKQLLSVHAEAIKEYKVILQLQKDYIPALKGLGETYLNLARSALEQDFNARAVDHVLDALRVLSRAVEYKPDLCCLWKLIGDCCTVIHPVSSCTVSATIPDNLKKYIPGETADVVGKIQLLALESSAYGRALKLQPECGTLWGDLGFCCFQQAKILDGEEKQKLAKRAVQALKKSLTLQPSSHKLWNILGVITASKEINHPELSQHSFIMSIKTEPNNVVAWTNLGVLYLKHGNIELAHEAFKHAQALDPSYTTAWIGQASIAEIIGSEEAMDLFRHTAELGCHVEGSIGFAHWLCSSMLPNKSRDNHVVQGDKPIPTLSHLHVEYRKSVLKSSGALSKYTDQIRNNAGAFNMFGILLEHQKLFLQAERAYMSAIKLLQENDNVNQQHLNTVLINHARILCSLGRYKEAASEYQHVKPLNTFHDVCGLALSLFMSGQFKESYQAYEQAFQLAENDADKSRVLTVMGMLGYASNDKEGARALLFNSSQLQPACEQGLMGLCALGLVSGDVTLAGAALGELIKRQTVSEELSSNICYLFSRFYALQGKERLGRSHIMKEIHRNPSNGLLWSQLASYLLQACLDELEAAANCAEASARLGWSHSAEHNPAFHPAGLVGSGALPHHVIQTSESNATNRTRAGLVAAQKAVHTHPDHVTSWAVLAAAVNAHDVSSSREGLATETRNLGARLSEFVEKTAIHQKDALECKSNQQLPALVTGRTTQLESLQSWALVHRGHCLLQSGGLQEAAEHVDQALSVYSSVPQISTKLHFLKAQISLASGDPVEIGLNMLQTSLLSSPVHSPNAWQVLAQVQAIHGSPMAAELCYRQCLQTGIDTRGRRWRVVPLLQLAMLAVQLAQNESNERDRWINLAMEASSEVLKLHSNSSAAILIQGIVHFLQDNTRSFRRALRQVTETRTGASVVAVYWLLLLHVKRNEISAAEELLSEVKFNSSKRWDLSFHQMARSDQFPPRVKLLLER